MKIIPMYIFNKSQIKYLQIVSTKITLLHLNQFTAWGMCNKLQYVLYFPK